MDKETSLRLCSGCLSADRFLEPLREHVELYLTLLGEYIYDTNKTDNTVLCWECKALLRRACFFQKRIQHSQLILHSLLPVKNHDTKLSRLSLTHVTVNSYSAEGVTNTLEIPLFKVNKNDNDVREESNSEVTVKEECFSESDNNEHYEVFFEVFETSNDILPKQETVDNEHYEAFETSNDNLPKQEAVKNEEEEEEVNSNKFNIDKEKLLIIDIEKNKPLNYETYKHKTPKATNDTKTSNKNILSCIECAGPSEDNQVPGPSKIRIIEKRAKSAEATRRWREKKKGVSESSKKQPKTAAQRMREYRKRKKLAKKILLQQSDQDLDATIASLYAHHHHK